ncbi:cilia- and flagella-associated protein 337-like isoform X2 [Branchiostoma floridae x Branchiostoma japonicum]
MKGQGGSDKKAGDAKSQSPASVVSFTGTESATGGGRTRKKRKGRSTHSVHKADRTRPSSSIPRPPSSRRRDSHHKKCRSTSHSAPSKSSVSKHARDTQTTSSTSVKRKKSARKRSVQSAKGKRSAKDDRKSVSETVPPSRETTVTPESSLESVLRVEYITHSPEEQEVRTHEESLSCEVDDSKTSQGKEPIQEVLNNGAMQDSVEENQFQDGRDHSDEGDSVVASLPRNDVSKSPSLREPSKQRKPALVCSVREAWGSANSTEKMDGRKNQHVRFSSSSSHRTEFSGSNDRDASQEEKDRRGIDSEQYNQLTRLLGLGKKDKRRAGLVTQGERKLLTNLADTRTAKMPADGSKKIRPSTAHGKIQSQRVMSIFDDSQRPQTAAPSGYDDGTASRATLAPSRQERAPTARPRVNQVQQPKGARRLTVGAVDGIGHNEAAHRIQVPANQGQVMKIEERISLEHLHKLKYYFEEADTDGSGALNLEEFKQVLKNCLGIRGRNEEQIVALFMKIDSSSDGEIAWDEFCTYMQLEYAEKEEAVLRDKDVAFHLPAAMGSTPHREPIVKVSHTPDNTFMALGQDGMVTFWSPNLDLKRTRTVVTEQQQANRIKNKWITDFVLMSQYNKFIIGTGDREIQFYELSNFEPYCQISGFETVPLKLDYCPTGPAECLVLFGDSEGCVNIVVIRNTGETLRTWKKFPKTEGIASVNVEVVANGSFTKYIRWKVHRDWVGQLRYYDDIRSVISCSNHANSALVIGCVSGSTHVEQQLKEISHDKSTASKSKMPSLAYAQTRKRLDTDETVFKIYKGVKTFDFSKEKNLIVTGGMDRIVRTWNPYVPSKPTGMLRGHNAPIFHLHISAEENRIFSVSTDKTVKVWDTSDQSCLITVTAKSHKIRGDLMCCHYSALAKSLAMVTDQLALLQLKMKSSLNADIVLSHKESVQCCKYNSSFKQVISCSDASVVKVWDFETGTQIFEFSGAHGDKPVTCMTFDSTERRLITGGRDGVLRIWNFNNGHCLKSLIKENTEEVTDCCYVELLRNRYVVSVGWDHRINIYADAAEDFHHYQSPLPKWTDDVAHGHKDDILSVATCPPNLLATSAYDGKVIVWNMVSGHIYCHLVSPELRSNTCSSSDDEDDNRLKQDTSDLSIKKVLFLKSRAGKKDAAQLIASGPKGQIHFWNIFQGGHLYGLVNGSKKQGTVTSMILNASDTVLYTTDSIGFVYVWDIDGFCEDGEAPIPPALIRDWRAHTQSITGMDLIEEHNIVITCALDCTVRVWTLDGNFVGTFGQPDPWDIYNPSTYSHPMVPYDVLVDPLSMPSHPVIDRRMSVADVVHADSMEGSDAGDDDDDLQRRPHTAPNFSTLHSELLVGDDEIAEELKRQPFGKAIGKRLRHEKMMNAPNKFKDHGGPNAYQSLQCYDLVDTPEIIPPNPSAEIDDPFADILD